MNPFFDDVFALKRAFVLCGMFPLKMANLSLLERILQHNLVVMNIKLTGFSGPSSPTWTPKDFEDKVTKD